MKRWSMILMVAWLGWTPACQVAPPADCRPLAASVYADCMRWSSGVIVSADHEWRPAVVSGDDLLNLPGGFEVGSATPVTADGYFMTAAHVLAGASEPSVFLCYGFEASWRQARIVWHDAKADLAILHVPMSTPGYFRWTRRQGWVAAGTHVFHLGIATGSVPLVGKMLTSLGPEKAWTGSRPFKIDVALQPGDSGGAVLDVDGRLIGINSAVEFLMPMETPIFIDSEAVRPSLNAVERVIREDRKQQPVRAVESW